MTEAGQNTEEGVWGSQGSHPSNCFQPEQSEWVSHTAHPISLWLFSCMWLPIALPPIHSTKHS